MLIKSLVHFISLIKQAEAVFELQGRARNRICERTEDSSLSISLSTGNIQMKSIVRERRKKGEFLFLSVSQV